MYLSLDFLKEKLGALYLLLNGLRINQRVDTKRLGTDYGGWSYCPTLINQKSIIYCFGIGEDVSFDLGLVEAHHCQIHAFDPTPKSILWVKQQSLPNSFKLHEYGLAAHDGEIKFYSPENPDHVSHTIMAKGTQAIIVPMRRLRTIMNEMGHDHIDLVKMDIEGAEYQVIQDLISAKIKIKQLLIEFHHHCPGIQIQQTSHAIRSLLTAGYKIFSISKSKHEVSFIWPYD